MLITRWAKNDRTRCLTVEKADILQDTSLIFYKDRRTADNQHKQVKSQVLLALSVNLNIFKWHHTMCSYIFVRLWLIYWSAYVTTHLFAEEPRPLNLYAATL